MDYDPSGRYLKSKYCCNLPVDICSESRFDLFVLIYIYNRFMSTKYHGFQIYIYINVFISMLTRQEVMLKWLQMSTSEVSMSIDVFSRLAASITLTLTLTASR